MTTQWTPPIPQSAPQHTPQVPSQRPPPPLPPAPVTNSRSARRRTLLWISLAAVVLLALVGGTYFLGRSAGTNAAPAPATAPAPAAPAMTPADRFVADVLDTPGLTTDLTRSELVGIGEQICNSIGTPGISHQVLTQTIAATKFGPVVAEVLTTAAETSMCPGLTYSTAPGVNVPTVTATPTGPAATVSEGTYEVGVDMAPGKYKTSGDSSCYYARLRKNDGSTGDIIDNNFGAGPQTVTVKAGEYFETQGCGVWTKVS